MSRNLPPIGGSVNHAEAFALANNPADFDYSEILALAYLDVVAATRAAKKPHGPPYTLSETFFPAGFYSLKDLEIVVASMKAAIAEQEAKKWLIP